MCNVHIVGRIVSMLPVLSPSSFVQSCGRVMSAVLLNFKVKYQISRSNKERQDCVNVKGSISLNVVRIVLRGGIPIAIRPLFVEVYDCN